jgi:hypothetical protein
MTTNKLRRELEELRQKSGHADCPGCGYPSYKNAKIVTKVSVIHSLADVKPPKPPEKCPVCGRDKLVIRMKGLNEKTRGNVTYRKAPTTPPEPLEAPDG